MLLVYYLLAALTTTPTEAIALQRSAPSYLTASAAWTNLVTARAAGAASSVDPDLLLAIAWHESRYRTDTATPLSPDSSMRSCGVLTPYPVDSWTCSAQTASLLAGYAAGADHVRVWLHATHGDLDRALGGVAGGYRFLGRCADRDDPPCDTPEIFLSRARRIKAMRQRALDGYHSAS